MIHHDSGVPVTGRKVTRLTYISWLPDRSDPLPGLLQEALGLEAIDVVGPRDTLPDGVEGIAPPWIAVQPGKVAGIVARFERRVKREDGPEDSPEGFRRFAMAEFSRWRHFRQIWTPAEGQPGGFADLTELAADPKAALPGLLGRIAPDILADAEAAAELAERIGQALRDTPAARAPEDFRFHDKALFDTLAAMTLTREEVVTTFEAVLGREPTDAAILEFQALPSLYRLQSRLIASPEFRNQPRKWKNGLRWPLSQVFVARPHRIMYCPIGKNGCTFLKTQMIKLAETPDEERLLRNVHVFTDNFNTGLQLSDYPRNTVQEMIKSPDYFRFAVIREPGDRLLSAYIEKFVRNRLNSGNTLQHTWTVVGPVQAARGIATPDFDLGISFRDFITWISGVPSRELDPHWRPQAHYLQGISWDRLYRFDDMDSLITDLEARSGHELDRSPLNVTGSGKGDLRPGAMDMLPGELSALPRIDRASFWDEELDSLVRTQFAEDYALYESI